VFAVVTHLTLARQHLQAGYSRVFLPFIHHIVCCLHGLHFMRGSALKVQAALTK
jgi:hypothetical protein